MTARRKKGKISKDVTCWWTSSWGQEAGTKLGPCRGRRSTSEPTGPTWSSLGWRSPITKTFKDYVRSLRPKRTTVSTKYCLQTHRWNASPLKVVKKLIMTIPAMMTIITRVIMKITITMTTERQYRNWTGLSGSPPKSALKDSLRRTPYQPVLCPPYPQRRPQSLWHDPRGPRVNTKSSICPLNPQNPLAHLQKATKGRAYPNPYIPRHLPSLPNANFKAFSKTEKRPLNYTSSQVWRLAPKTLTIM